LAFEQLLRRLENQIGEKEDETSKQDLELLPLYVNPESKIMKVSEDAFSHLKALRRVNSTLKRFNLSKNEVRVYLYLARFGAQKALTIAQALDIHRTEVYKILNGLESQGLVKRILERPLRFMAVPLEKVLNNFIEDRRRRVLQLEKSRDLLLDVWRDLPQAGDVNIKKQTYQVLESRRQIWLKIKELAEECEDSFFMVIKEKDVIWLYNTTLFEDLEEVIARKGIKVSLITNYSEEHGYLPEGIEIEGARIRFLKKLDLPSFFLSDDREIILILESGGNDISGMWTNYTSMTKSYRMLFHLLQKKLN